MLALLETPRIAEPANLGRAPIARLEAQTEKAQQGCALRSKGSRV